MKKEDILTELLAMRARLDEMIEKVRAHDDAPAPANTNAEPRWMKLSTYAKRWNMSRATLYKRIVDGLPVDGTGHARRVDVREADAWMTRRGQRKSA